MGHLGKADFSGGGTFISCISHPFSTCRSYQLESGPLPRHLHPQGWMEDRHIFRTTAKALMPTSPRGPRWPPPDFACPRLSHLSHFSNSNPVLLLLVPGLPSTGSKSMNNLLLFVDLISLRSALPTFLRWMVTGLIPLPGKH